MNLDKNANDALKNGVSAIQSVNLDNLLSQMNLNSANSNMTPEEAHAAIQNVIQPIQNLQPVTPALDASVMLEQTKTAIEQAVNALRQSTQE